MSRVRFVARIASALLTVASLGGCGGAGSSPAAPHLVASPRDAAQRANVRIELKIPKRPNVASRYHRLYVSSGIQQLRVTDSTGTIPFATLDLHAPGTPGSPCTPPDANGATLCTTDAAFPVGTALYLFQEIGTSAANASGQLGGVLAASQILVTINPPGSPNVIAAALGGVPATLVLAFGSAPTLGMPADVAVVFTALDDSGAAIVGGDPFVVPGGAPTFVHVEDIDTSGVTSLSLDGGAPVAKADLSKPSDTLVLHYNGKPGLATLVASIASSPAPPVSLAFVPSKFPPKLIPVVAGLPGLFDLARTPDASPAVDVAYATVDANSNPIAGLTRVDASGATPLATFDTIGANPIVSPGSAPSQHTTVFGGNGVATVPPAGGTVAVVPYSGPLAGVGASIPYYGARTYGFDGTAWVVGYQTITGLRPDGSTVAVSYDTVAYPQISEACTAPDGSLIFLNYGAGPPLLRIDGHSGAALAAPPLAPSVTLPQVCTLAHDGKSLWFLYLNTAGVTTLGRMTFGNPATLAAPTFIEYPPIVGFEAGTNATIASHGFLAGNDAVGDSTLYWINVGFIDPYSIVQLDPQTSAQRSFPIPNASPYIAFTLGNDNDVWYVSDSGSVGYLKVVP